MSKTHIIHRINLYIDAADIKQADYAKNEVLNQLRTKILPELEKWLDRLEADFYPDTLQMDSLNIELGKLSPGEIRNRINIFLEKELKDRVFEQSAKSGLVRIGSGTDESESEIALITKLSPVEKAWKIFRVILLTGKLPWFVRPDDFYREEYTWLKLLTGKIDAARLIQLKELLSIYESALSRLIHQFPAWFLPELLLKIKEYYPRLPDITPVRKNIFPQSNAESSRTLYHSFIKRWLNETIDGGINKLSDLPHFPGNIEQDEDIDASILKDQDMEDIPQLADSQPSAFPDKKPESGVFTGQAGLVLLHPFLEYFFKDYGLVQNNDFADLQARQLAVHLLHYLATGRQYPSEAVLDLEKYLCQWPEDMVPERFIKIPLRMRKEADKLLQAVIDHWKALKNTSPGGLREGFLQRSGKLLRNESPSRLIVESKSIDVLLGHMPWAYHIIRLPWMDQPLYVDWNQII